MPRTKESGSGEAIALAANLSYEPTPDEMQRASDLILDLVAERDALREALEQIARFGVSFDAHGTRSKQVNEIARRALGRPE